ncbi:peptide chain release factor 2 [Candidatus Falkowbacteria bacterium]|nr:peptide chain release factor 2 [Candidatus Falkowbacteria bacterium]
MKTLEREMNQPDFWQNQEKARSVSQKCDHLKAIVNDWDNLSSSLADALKLAKESVAETDDSLAQDIEKEYGKLLSIFEKLEFLVLFSEKYDSNNALVSIHAGTGGVEAQDWAEMLTRMYFRYCENKEFTVKIVDQSRGNEAGLKSITFAVTGPYAYGNLKSEAGVHRLVRISPFDAEKMRHTSFALVEVLPELPETDEIEIKEGDLKIETFRSAGPGGQGVNTTDSAVRITHLPSGLSVKCQNQRSQKQNKITALKILQSKLFKLQELAQGRELAKIRGELASAEWGNQIRSYVLQPYKMVKDHRTGFGSKDPESVLDGRLDELVESYLRYISQQDKFVG